MAIAEILNTIHEERLELEVFEALHKWMIENEVRWTTKTMDPEDLINTFFDKGLVGVYNLGLKNMLAMINPQSPKDIN